MEEKTMSYFRDSSRPEDYWGDGQWKIYKTMKEMDILPASDNLMIPNHISGSGSETRKARADLPGEIPRSTAVLDTGLAGMVKTRAPKVANTASLTASGFGGDAQSDDPCARWDAAAKAMKWQDDMMPPTRSASDAIAGIGSLIDGLKKKRPAGVARAAAPAATPVNTPAFKAEGAPAHRTPPAESQPAGRTGWESDQDAEQSRRKSYQAGLYYGGRDPADEAQARKDWQEIPGARAAGYVTRAFYDGNIATGGKFTDPFIHGYNLYKADFTPVEHLSPEENEMVERRNAEVVLGLKEVGEDAKELTQYQKGRDVDLHTSGKTTLLGELTDKSSVAANHAGRALLDTAGGKLWQAFSVGSDAASAAMKTYRNKMLAYRTWRDDEICDPAVNSLFGAWCQRKIRAGENKRTVAMQTRQNMAIVHALKEAGIDIGINQLKNWFGGATGHAGEGPLIRFWQNMGMDVVEKQAENAWDAYGKDVAERGREALDAINDAHEWHMNNN